MNNGALWVLETAEQRAHIDLIRSTYMFVACQRGDDIFDWNTGLAFAPPHAIDELVARD